MFSWTAPTNEVFSVDYSTEIPTTNWLSLTNIITSTNGTFRFTDHGVRSGGLGGNKFYRLKTAQYYAGHLGDAEAVMSLRQPMFSGANIVTFLPQQLSSTKPQIDADSAVMGPSLKVGNEGISLDRKAVRRGILRG
jgi:hypothetical protein